MKIIFFHIFFLIIFRTYFNEIFSIYFFSMVTSRPLIESCVRFVLIGTTSQNKVVIMSSDSQYEEAF
jgi:hypothetical protein